MHAAHAYRGREDPEYKGMRTMQRRDTVHAMHAHYWDRGAVSRLTKELIDATDLPRTDLASLAGVAPSQISRWSAGQTRPGQDKLEQLRSGLSERLGGQPAEAADRVMVGLMRAAGYPVNDQRVIEDPDETGIRALGLPPAETEMLLSLRRSQRQQLADLAEELRKRTKDKEDGNNSG